MVFYKNIDLLLHLIDFNGASDVFETIFLPISAKYTLKELAI